MPYVIVDPINTVGWAIAVNTTPLSCRHDKVYVQIGFHTLRHQFARSDNELSPTQKMPYGYSDVATGILQYIHQFVSAPKQISNHLTYREGSANSTPVVSASSMDVQPLVVKT
jgi:hypothetical protein